MLDLSRCLFLEWNNHDILYCHWKSNEHLEDGLMGLTDLDVLVSFNHKTNCETILENLDFIKCNQPYGSRYPGVDDWLGCDTQTGKMVHIHLHYQIITGHRGMKEYHLPWSQEALDTRIQDNHTGVFIMEPNLEIMTLYARIALKASTKTIHAAQKGNFKLDDGYLKEITYLKQQIDLTTLAVLIKKYFGDEKKLGDLIQKEVLMSGDFLLLHKYVTKSMKAYRTTNFLLSLVQKNYFRVALPVRVILRNRVNRFIIQKKTPQNRGLMIAFIGQDGSGKSTVTNEILEWLTWKLDANKFYLGSGEHYQSWQKELKKIMDKKKKYKIAVILSALLTLSNHISVARRIYKFVNHGKRYALNGGIAIFDRYPQTIHYGINDGPKIRFNYLDRIRSPLLKKYIIYCAKAEEYYLTRAAGVVPEIVFKLILPPEVSIIRKPEENLETIQNKHEIINSLSFGQAKVYLIDANQEYTGEIKEIKGLIWGNMPKSKSSSLMDWREVAKLPWPEN